MPLRNIQQTIAQYVTAEKRSAAPPENALPPQRLSIYRNNFQQTLLQVLADIYPVCCQLVGEQCFHSLALYYAQQYPPHTFTLDQYGEHFSAFLDTVETLQALPYLGDIAQLEWAAHFAVLQPNSAALSLDKLATVPAEQHAQLIFHLPPSVTLLQSKYPVYQIWQAHQETTSQNWQINLEQDGEAVMVWQKNYKLKVDLLTPEEAQLLTAIQQQRTLSDLFTSVDQTIDVTSYLPCLIQKGWLCDCTVKST